MIIDFAYKELVFEKKCMNLETSRRHFIRLEYGQAVWSPYLQKHINTLENVQIRATKLVDGLGKLEYSERLKRLNLPTLVYRRRRGDMIELFKHFNTYDKSILAPTFQPRDRPSRQHNYQLHFPKSSDGKRGTQTNSFYHLRYRIICQVKLWIRKRLSFSKII